MTSIYATCYILGAHPRTAFWIIGKCANTFLEHVITTVVADKRDFTRKDLACFLLTWRRIHKRYFAEQVKSGKNFPRFKMGGW